jgi:hypothetical protein
MDVADIIRRIRARSQEKYDALNLREMGEHPDISPRMLWLLREARRKAHRHRYRQEYNRRPEVVARRREKAIWTLDV